MTPATLTLAALVLLPAMSARPQFYYQPPLQQQAGYYYLPQSPVPSFEPVSINGGPAEYVLVYAGPPQHQTPILLRQTPVEESVGEETNEQPPRPPSWWQTFIQSFNGLQPNPDTTTPPPVIAPAEEAPVVAPAEEAPVVTPASEEAPVVTPASEETTPPSAAPDKPEKVLEIMIADEMNHAALEDLGEEAASSDDAVPDDDERVEPTSTPSPPPPSPRPGLALPAPQPGFMDLGPRPGYVAVQEPQFFGSFDFLRRGQQVGPNSAAGPGGLFRNPPAGFQFPPLVAPAFSYSRHQAAPVSPEQRGAYIPGQRHVDVSAQLGQYVAGQAGVVAAPQEVQAFQSSPGQPGLINVGPGYQNVYFITSKKPAEESQALKGKKEDVSNATVDNSTSSEEQAGPSVAQAKPQAIALAGVGGVAAATPVATAVVGAGGLAVSAPTATAVAGTSGAVPVPGPAAAAVNKYFHGNKQSDGGDEREMHGVVAYSL